jgi:hypothetical protein
MLRAGLITMAPAAAFYIAFVYLRLLAEVAAQDQDEQAEPEAEQERDAPAPGRDLGRGLFGSFACSSSGGGMLLGSLAGVLVTSLLDPAEVAAWGMVMSPARSIVPPSEASASRSGERAVARATGAASSPRLVRARAAACCSAPSPGCW